MKDPFRPRRRPRRKDHDAFRPPLLCSPPPQPPRPPPRLLLQLDSLRDLFFETPLDDLLRYATSPSKLGLRFRPAKDPNARVPFKINLNILLIY